MENISVNELTDSTNSSLPREIKVALAREVLSQEENIEKAKEKFSEIVKNLEQKKQNVVLELIWIELLLLRKSYLLKKKIILKE